MEQDELIKSDAANSFNRLIASKLSSAKLQTFDNLQRGDESENINESQQAILPINSRNEQINVRIAERNPKSKNGKRNTQGQSFHSRAQSLQRRMMEKTTDMSSINCSVPIHDLDSSHHLALGKRQIATLQTQANIFALNSRQRKLSLRYQKPVENMKNKRRSDIGMHHKAIHLTQENALNFDIVKVQPATSMATTPVLTTKPSQTRKFYPATSYILDPSYKKSFQIIDGGCPAANNNKAHSLLRPMSNPCRNPAAPHLQIPYPAVDKVHGTGRLLVDPSSSSHPKPSFAPTPHNLDSPPHTSIPTKTFSFQFAQERTKTANKESNREDTNGGLSERMMSCRDVGSRKAIEVQPGPDDQINVEEVEINGGAGEDEEEVKCGDGLWIDQVRTIQPSLERPLRAENKYTEYKKRSIRSKKGSIVRMNIETLVMDEKEPNHGMTINKQDTFLSMSDIESFRQMKGIEQIQEATIQQRGSVGVSGDNILEEIAQTQKNVRQAMRWKSRSGENWLAAKFPSNRKFSRFNQQNDGNTAKTSRQRGVYIVTDNAGGTQRSTVAMTAKLPRPQSKTAGGGFSKNIVVKKLERGQQQRQMNVSSYSGKPSGLLRHQPPASSSNQASRPSTNFDNHQVNVTNFIQQMKYSSSQHRHSKLTNEIKYRRSQMASNPKKISEPWKDEEQKVLSTDDGQDPKKRDQEDNADSAVSRMKKKTSPLRVSCSQSTLMGIMSKNNLQMSSHQSQLPGNVSHINPKRGALESPGNELGTQELAEPAQRESKSRQSLCQDTAFFPGQKKPLNNTLKHSKDEIKKLKLVQQTFSGSFQGSLNVDHMIKQNAQPPLQLKKQQQIKMMKEMMQNQKKSVSPPAGKVIEQANAKDDKGAASGVSHINLDLVPMNSQATQMENQTIYRVKEDSFASPGQSKTNYIYENEQHRGAYRCHEQPRVLRVIKKMAGNSRQYTRNALKGATSESPKATQTQQPATQQQMPEQAFETANSIYQTVDQSLTNPTLLVSPSPTSPTQVPRTLNTIDDLAATLRRGDSPPFATTKGVAIYPSRPPYTRAAKGSKTMGTGATSPAPPQFILHNLPPRKSQLCETAKKDQEDGDGSLRTVEVGQSEEPVEKTRRDLKQVSYEEVRQTVPNADLHDELDSGSKIKDKAKNQDKGRNGRERKRYWSRVREKPMGEQEHKSREQKAELLKKVYTPKEEDLQAQLQLDKKINELFRKKQPVIRVPSSKGRQTNTSQDIGIRLAAELASEHAFYLKPSSTIENPSKKQPTKHKDSEDKKESETGSKQVSHQMKQLRQIKAMEELARINNVKLQMNQGMSFEALNELRRETYLMSPTVDKLSQNAIPPIQRNVKFMEEEPEEEETPPTTQNQSSTFQRNANTTFQHLDSLHHLLTDAALQNQNQGGKSRAIAITNQATHPNPLNSLTSSPSASPSKRLAPQFNIARQQLQIQKGAQTYHPTPSQSSSGLVDHAQYLQELRSYYAHTLPTSCPPTTSPPTIQELAQMAARMQGGTEGRRRSELCHMARVSDLLSDDAEVGAIVQKIVVERRFGGGPGGATGAAGGKVQVHEVI